MTSVQSISMKLSKDLRIRHAPTELERRILEKLTFANPVWTENERMGRWNRDTPKVLRFYHRDRGELVVPRGYVRHVIRLCRAQGLEYRIIDRRRHLPPVDFSFNGTLKPYQQTAVQAMLAKDFGTLTAPPGSGKTVMAISMIAKRRQPALVIVHTKELAYQWVARLQQFLGLSKEAVGLIGDGQNRLTDGVTVALVQSLYKRAAAAAPQVGFLLVDECHRCPSRTFTQAVSTFDSQYMLGLSATPFRRDRLSRLIFWHLGNVHHQVETQGLVASGDVLPAEVIIRPTTFKPFYDPVHEYSKMLLELTADDERNRLIAADVAQETRHISGVCLVLSDRKRHCETLRALLRFKHGVDAQVLTGDLNGTDRQAVIEKVNKGATRVLIATGQLIGEGFDCHALHTLFLATPIRFSGRLIQYLGRVLRPAAGKEHARVYDYIDVHVEPLKTAARYRRRVYDRQPVANP